MLRRTALVLLGLLVTATAGIFAADRLGVNLPWSIASNEAPEQPSPATEATQPVENTDAAASAERAIEDTVAALSSDTPDATDPAKGSVALDISLISPDGPSVFAGRADPRAYITVFADGKAAGTVQADDGGSWSLSTEQKFASADPNITFESAPTPPAVSEPAPAVAEPAPPAETATAEETAEAIASAEAAATEQATEDAPAAAGDVMRKFEELVSEAREDAAREKAAEEEAAREKKDAERRQLAQAQTQAALKAQRDAEQSATETARKETERQDAEKKQAEQKAAERETVVAAATATPAPTSAAAASEEPAASSDTSASADAVPGAKSTVDSDTAGKDTKDTETKAALLGAPGKSAKPETQAPIPVPIMFVYNQATLTPEGERAAELLLEYLLLKRLDSVELTGHADERGTHNYNFDLSRERLEAVSRILTNGGYKGDLKLTPKGKTEPFKGIDRRKYRGEALYQFDRRVELRVTR